ncbi:MAG: YicC family protein [Ignavibacteriae bacterium]|nr:YicC family protein [Ignavibacteriota bacterium]
MIFSMTGYGSGEAERNGISARAEVRSVNNRFMELTVRLPRSLQLRENDAKEFVRKQLTRGKINVSVTVERDNAEELPITVNEAAVKAYMNLLQDIRKISGIQEEVSLQHLLTFSEIFEAPEGDETDTEEWEVALEALTKAIDSLMTMRSNEGKELEKDVRSRINLIADTVEEIDAMSKERIPNERVKLRERVAQLASDVSIIDDKRLELEIILLSDKLDVTEECVRFRSHTKFFLEALKKDESAGRKLTFLLQEMNREANTIGSKTMDAEIAQKVVLIKEELEKIREQLQNIE